MYQLKHVLSSHNQDRPNQDTPRSEMLAGVSAQLPVTCWNKLCRLASVTHHSVDPSCPLMAPHVCACAADTARAGGHSYPE